MQHTIYGWISPKESSQGIKSGETTEGEPIEARVERIMTQNEPITDGAPIIYTDRKDGVIPEYNVRTDRFELALDYTDIQTKQILTRREEFHKALEKGNEKNPPEPPQGGKV